MTDFIQGLISNGEDFESARILLEAQWPEMIGRVEFNWLEYVARPGNSEEMTQNVPRTECNEDNAAKLAKGEREASALFHFPTNLTSGLLISPWSRNENTSS